MRNFEYVVNNTDYFDMNVQISRCDAGRTNFYVNNIQLQAIN